MRSGLGICKGAGNKTRELKLGSGGRDGHGDEGEKKWNPKSDREKVIVKQKQLRFRESCQSRAGKVRWLFPNPQAAQTRLSTTSIRAEYFPGRQNVQSWLGAPNAP